MTVRLTRCKPLVYYDGVQVFEGFDAIGGGYLGVLLPEGKYSGEYLVVGITPESLQNLRRGAIDLRTAIVERLGHHAFLSASPVDLTQGVQLNDIDGSRILEADLPLNGFLLFSGVADSSVLELARSRGGLVLDYKLEPRGASSGTAIQAKWLARILDSTSSLFKNAIIAAGKRLRRKPEDWTSDMPLTVLAPPLAGSFRLLMGTDESDLFGGGKTLLAMGVIDEVVDRSESPEATLELLRSIGGHFPKSYLRLLTNLKEVGSNLQYTWAIPSEPRTFRPHVLHYQHIEPLINLLASQIDLLTTTETLVGVLHMGNDKSGAWILEAEDGIYSGTANPELVKGLTLGHRYSFECAVSIEEVALTGAEVKTYNVQRVVDG